MMVAAKRLYEACKNSYLAYHKGTGCMHMPLYKEGDTDITNCLQTSHELLLTSIMRRHVGSVLDVGCGVGALSVAIARLGAKVTGIALTDSEIEEANMRSRAAHQNANCRFLIHDMNDLSGLREAFDVVVNLETDCYYASARHAVHQVVQVLVDGGEWHALRFSIHPIQKHNPKALKLAAHIALCWRSSPWSASDDFTSATEDLFHVVRNDDLSSSVLAFWQNLMPLSVESPIAVRLRFATRAMRESRRLYDFPVVYRHRIAFWFFMLGLSRGWFEYRYVVLRKRAF